MSRIIKLLPWILLPLNVFASTFTVDNTSVDAVDGTPGEGICRIAGAGPGDPGCTLRAAIQEANATPGTDVIDFDPSTDGTPTILTLHGAGEELAATGDLDITAGLTINGRGPDATIIDGDAADRVIHIIRSSGTFIVSLRHLTIRNGGNVDAGGGIRMAGADLQLSDTHIINNHATGTSTVFGGGIHFNGGAFSADASLISGNSATSGSGYVYGGGLELESYTNASISNSEISNNLAQSGSGGTGGGGISSNSPLIMTNSSVRNNTAHSDTEQANGGGISSSNGSLSLKQVEVSNNVASGASGSSGGGIVSSQVTALVNTTVSGNQAPRVGGIYQSYDVLMMVNSTVANNHSNNDFISVGGIMVSSSADASIANTLIAANHGHWPDCYTSVSITSGGYNLIGDATGCTITATTGDLLGTDASPIDPLLGPLMQNGPNRAQPLLAGSPAIDAGDPQPQSNGGNCQIYDQLGTIRPIDGNGDGIARCDIGAVEWDEHIFSNGFE